MEASMTNTLHVDPISFDEALRILYDDANIRSRLFLERINSTHWRISGLFGETNKVITQDTFLHLVKEQKIKAEKTGSAHFVPI